MGVAVTGCSRPTASRYNIYFDTIDSTRYMLPATMDALVADGRGSEIGTLIAQARNGSSPNMVPEDRFGINVVGGSTPAQVQTALRAGYVAGCASAAFYRRGTAFRRMTGGDVETMAEVLRALDPSLDVRVTHRPFARLLVDGEPIDAGDEAATLRSAAELKDSRGQRYINESAREHILAHDQCWAIPRDRR